MTGLQSNAAQRRPLRVPTAEELPPLLPRSPLAIFDEAITFLRIQPALLFGVTLIVLLPLRLIAAAMPGSALRDARPDEVFDILIGNLEQPGAVTAAIATLVLDSIALLTVGSIFGELIASWYSGRSMSATDLLVSSIKRSPVILLTWAITHGIVIVGSLITAGMLGLFSAFFLVVVGPVLGAEAAKPIEAMRRSSQLASAKLGQAMLVFLITGFGGLLMRITIEFAPTLFTNAVNVPLWLSAGIFDIVASVVVISFTAASATVLYLDLRVRREGIDLDMAITRSFGTSAVGRGDGGG